MFSSYPTSIVSLFVTFLFWCVSLSAASTAGADSLTGFRDISWGDAREKHGDIAGVFSGFHLSGARKNDPGKWLNLPLWQGPKGMPSFIYHFDRDHGFYAANSMLAPGLSNDAIKKCIDDMVAMLGPPTEKN